MFQTSGKYTHLWFHQSLVFQTCWQFLWGIYHHAKKRKNYHLLQRFRQLKKLFASSFQYWEIRVAAQYWFYRAPLWEQTFHDTEPLQNTYTVFFDLSCRSHHSLSATFFKFISGLIWVFIKIFFAKWNNPLQEDLRYFSHILNLLCPIDYINLAIKYRHSDPCNS